MHRPAPFREDNPTACAEVIRTHPFASLLWIEGGMPTSEPAPLLLSADGSTLTGHLACNNGLVEASPSRLTALFRGPDAYISPSWYPSKAEHGKVVPTWNYVAVEAACSVRWIHDTEELRSIVEHLTDRFEATVGSDWRVSDAPEPFVQTMLDNIVGFELTIESLRGKFKLSQNKSRQDQQAVAQQLSERSTTGDMAELMVPHES